MSTELSEAFVREQTLTRLAEQVRATGQALPGTEAQIAQLIKDEFVLGVGTDGLPALQAKDGRPAGDVIQAKLSDEAFSHFRAPTEPPTEGHRLLDQARATGRGPLGRWLPVAGAAREGL